MPNIHTPKNIEEVPLSIIKTMVGLATSGFGVVVALSWNEAIKKTIETYVDPWLGKSSGVISLFIYALAITLLAVFITMQLAVLQQKFEQLEQNFKLKKKKN